MMTELSKEGAEEWRKIESEEGKLERLEMKEIKENLWRWRSTKNLKNKISEKEKLTSEEKHRILKEILAREKVKDKIEKDRRKKKQSEKEKEWITRREEKELERKERKQRQKKCEETWETLRWAMKILEETRN